MARELVTHIWCDQCLRTEGEEPVYTKAEELPPVTLGALKPRVLALCEPHRKEFYDPFRELVAEVGQVVPDSPGGGAAARTSSPKVVREYPCPVPECPKHTNPFKHDSSRAKHCQEVHGATAGELARKHGSADQPALLLHDEGVLTGEPVTPPEVQRTECPECGRVFQWPDNPRPTQALGVHRSRSHGVTSTNPKSVKTMAQRKARQKGAEE